MEDFMKRRLFYAAACSAVVGAAIIAGSCADSGVEAAIAAVAPDVGDYSISISPNVQEIGGNAFTNKTKANKGALVTLTVIPPIAAEENGEGGGGGVYSSES
jgi:hypothetical protein